MPKRERRHIQLDDGENGRFYAEWSRSGKHLIVTVGRQDSWDQVQQVELTPVQLEVLCRFVAETAAQAPRDR